MGRKIFLLGFVVLLLVGIPATLYILQRQQTITSQAQKATVLSFTPATTSKNPGETFTTDLVVNPGTNLVSFIKVDITYDASVLEVSGPEAFVKNAGAFPQTLEGPVVQAGRIAATLSIGSDPTNAIQTTTTVATITFKVRDDAAGGASNIALSSNTQVLSIGSGDQAAENVLLSSDPMQVTVSGAQVSPTTAPTTAPTSAIATPTTAPTTAPTAVPTLTRTPTPSPTQPPTGGGNPTATPTQTPTPTQQASTGGGNPTATPTQTLIAQGNTPTPTRAAIANTNQTTTPTLAPTGPTENIMGVGVILAFLVLIGGYFFFSLK